jgi:hypothetical protein
MWNVTIIFIVSVCVSIRMEQLRSQQMYFIEIWCLSIFH